MVLFPHIELSITESLPRGYYLGKIIWLMDWGAIWKKIVFSSAFISFYEFMPSN